MKKTFISLFVATLMFGFASGAKAAVITFEGLPNSSYVPNGFKGFNWQGFEVFGITTIHSGGYGMLSSDELFKVNSLDLSNYAWNSPTILINGYKNNNPIPIYQQYKTAGYDDPYVNLGWDNLNKLEFVFFSGAYSSQFIVYNLDIDFTPSPTPAPEPASMLLGLMGLAGAMGWRKRKIEA